MASTEIAVFPRDDENEPVANSIVSISPALASNAPSILAAYTAAMPKFDFSAIVPTFDVASLLAGINATALEGVANTPSMMPKIETLVPSLNLAALMPKFDYTSLMPRTGVTEITRMQDSLLAELSDYSKTLDGSRTSWLATVQSQIDFTATLQPILDMLRSFDWDSITNPLRVPDNWPDDVHEHLPALVEMVNRDGIPAAWVPRSEVLTPLLAASAGDERSEVLIQHRVEILDDCLAWLNDLSDPVLDPVLPIAREVLDACRNGFWKVGAISAVQVVHSIVESLHWVSDRQRVAKHHGLTMETPYAHLLEQATRAPLVLFYDDWNPLSGKPRPAHLTRHVVSHRLGEDQVNERNCIVAVMLMASLLVTVYQLDLGQKAIAA